MLSDSSSSYTYTLAHFQSDNRTVSCTIKKASLLEAFLIVKLHMLLDFQKINYCKIREKTFAYSVTHKTSNLV